jgi:hypothetical protein
VSPYTDTVQTAWHRGHWHFASATRHEGHVYTDAGLVHAVSEKIGSFGQTELTAAWEGRVYVRRYAKHFRSPHCVTLARRFACAVVAGEVVPAQPG